MVVDDRNIKLDLIRVFSMFFVIMVHTLVKLFYSNNIFRIAMESILFTEVAVLWGTPRIIVVPQDAR